MHLVKWIRKNQSKVMAWVVIFLMISFVGGYGLQQLLSYSGGGNTLVGQYNGEKLRQADLQTAYSELEILKGLMVEQILYSGQDLNGQLLGLLLFPNNQITSQIRDQFVQAGARGQIQMSREQIDQYFAGLVEQPELMWVLLKAEAHKAGVVVSPENAMANLQQFIPAVTQGVYGQRIEAAQFLYNLSRQTGRTEQEIADVFAELLGVLKYGGYIMSNHVVTYNEMQSEVLRNVEKLSGEYYVLNAQRIADEQPEPTQEQIQAQFDEYKDEFSGTYSEENPYGFGYKIPRRTAFEYLYVDLNDVKEEIDPVTPEDMERYYSSNLSQYQDEVPVDPNDPEGETEVQQRSFAEVAGRIRQTLEQQRTESLAARILNDARQMTEAGFDAIDLNEATEQQLQDAAGEYTAAARTLEEKYQIPVKVGKTSPMRPKDYMSDMVLRGLMLTGPEGKRIQLREIAYQVPADGTPLRQVGMPSIRMWENISPLMGGFYDAEQSDFVQLMGMARVTDVIAPQVPESTDVQFSIQGAQQAVGAADTYSLREEVVSDLKLKQAMEVTQQRAQTLVSLVEEKGWDGALDSYREQFTMGADPNQPVAATPLPQMRTLNSQMVPSRSALTLMQRQMADPSMADYMRNQFQTGLRARMLYSLLDPGQETTGMVDRPVVFPPAGEVLVAKELTREPATVKDFEENKDMLALQAAYMAGIDLGLVHYNPENVKERLEFVRAASEDDEVAEAETQS